MTLIITDDDFAHFDALSAQQFLRELYNYCETKLPFWTQKTSKESAINALKFNVNRAKSFGFKQRGSLYFCTDLSILLGANFYQDVQYFSINESIQQNHRQNESRHIKTLFEKTSDYFEHVFEKNRFF